MSMRTTSAAAAASAGVWPCCDRESVQPRKHHPHAQSADDLARGSGNALQGSASRLARPPLRSIVYLRNAGIPVLLCLLAIAQMGCADATVLQVDALIAKVRAIRDAEDERRVYQAINSLPGSYGVTAFDASGQDLEGWYRQPDYSAVASITIFWGEYGRCVTTTVYEFRNLHYLLLE